MIKHENDKRLVFHFDSVADMVQFLDSTPRQWREDSSISNFSTQQWDLGVGYAGALRMAREGWTEGVAMVTALIDSLPMSSSPRLVYSVAGDYADVARAVAGDPFNMVRRGKAHKQRPVMTIAIACNASSAVHARALATFAAAMVAVVDKLESRGVSVELIGAAPTDLTRKRGSVTWTIKRAGEALDFSAVAFSIGHPAMFRRLVFGAWERFHSYMHQYGYGSVPALRKSDFIDLPSDALIVSGVGRGGADHCRSIEEAVAFAENQLNEAAAKLGQSPIAELEPYEVRPA